jgi:integrase
MTPTETDLFLATIGEEHRLYALYFAALATGMRQAELIGLRWKNVQLVEKDGRQPHIRVREEIRQVDGKATRLPPKK